MKKEKRMQVYEKYDGHCAYCGKKMEYKDIQVDHIEPRCRYGDKKIADRLDNLNPSCRRCNHYKRNSSLESFRQTLKTLHKRVSLKG